MKNKTKFSSGDRSIISLEVTPAVHDCSCCVNAGKCGKETQQDDLHATLFPKSRDRAAMQNYYAYTRPDVNDPGSETKTAEQKFQRRRLREALGLSPADNITMPDVYAFNRKPVNVEKEQAPSDELSDAARKLILESQQTREDLFQFKGRVKLEEEVESGSSTEQVISEAQRVRRAIDTVNVLRAAAIKRVEATYADRLISESREHTRLMAAERRAEWEQKHPRTKSARQGKVT